MQPEGTARLEQLLKTSSIYLEYGAGGSTVMAADLGVSEIHSVESHGEFLAAVQSRVKSRRPSARLVAHLIDVGPTKEWGRPAEPAAAPQWPQYCVTPWRWFLAHSTSPDLVLIDGRFRVACFLASLLCARAGTVLLFDDYAGRKKYHVVERFAPIRKQLGRMAEFVVPEALDHRSLALQLVLSATDPA